MERLLFVAYGGDKYHHHVLGVFSTEEKALAVDGCRYAEGVIVDENEGKGPLPKGAVWGESKTFVIDAKTAPSAEVK